MKKTGIIIIILGFILSMNVNAQETKKADEITIKSSVVCGSCKARIEQNMAYVKGFKSVNVDLKKKEIFISYNPKKTNAEELKTAITKIGYDADDMIADEQAYSKLPACCKKDAEPHD